MKQQITSSDARRALHNRLRRIIFATLVAVFGTVAVSFLPSCSSVRHVPDGQMLLDNVTINIIDNDTIKSDQLVNYLRQSPNHKVLGFAKLQLGLYNMSGKDSTKWYNRWVRRMGQAPVIYDSLLTQASARQLTTAMVNRGFLEAVVETETKARPDKKRIDVAYNITLGTPHTVQSFTIESDDPAIDSILQAEMPPQTVATGAPLDRNMLDAVRDRVSSLLRNRGYYAFTKESVSFVADTTAGSTQVDLTMKVSLPPSVKLSTGQSAGPSEHLTYIIDHVYFVTDYDGRKSGRELSFPDRDTLRYKSIDVLYGTDRYIKPSILEEKCFIRPGQPYNDNDIDRTYQALSQLPILRFINIELKPVATIDGQVWTDVYVLLSRNKKQSIAVELEGTNSEGDLGFGVGLTYQHRNLGHRSELFSAKFRAAYESLNGNLDGIINDRYTEYAGEVGITFPKFKAPFLSKSFKQRVRANTQLALTTTYQERPEYTRVIAGAAWKYKWTTPRRNFTSTHTYDLIDVNYVYLPHSTINFIDAIAPDNPLLRYSYEDHFIMRMGYTYYRTNRRIPTVNQNSFELQPSITTLRASAEVAGNLLYTISSIAGQKRSDGAYKIFGIQYAQYVKGEVDWTHTQFLTSRQALAFHAGFGIEYPYGNSSAVPFEKRFYAGGANNIRGWSARSLGPGAYDGHNDVIDFINQCGDIRLDLSLEYRFRLFWVFEGALFMDAGNIWTIKNYQNQPGGMFKFNKFYNQIAAAYGLGLRMDFTYFLLRFDLGMKAHNPATNQEPWPLVNPNWKRDATFHFAVGYPF